MQMHVGAGGGGQAAQWRRRGAPYNHKQVPCLTDAQSIQFREMHEVVYKRVIRLLFVSGALGGLHRNDTAGWRDLWMTVNMYTGRSGTHVWLLGMRAERLTPLLRCKDFGAACASSLKGFQALVAVRCWLLPGRPVQCRLCSRAARLQRTPIVACYLIVWAMHAGFCATGRGPVQLWISPCVDSRLPITYIVGLENTNSRAGRANKLTN